MFAVVALLPLGGGVASAHAVLESTDPASGAVLAQSPRRVLLQFSEEVTLLPNGVQVYDPELDEVDRGSTGHLTGEPNVVGVRLKPDLPAGTYTVTYRVISADSHPVSGGFRFSVGHPSAAGAPAPAVSSGGGAGAGLMAAARWVGYAGAVLAVGAALVLLWLWPAGRSDRRARSLTWSGFMLLTLGAAGQFLIQGPYATGADLTEFANPALLSETISTRFGQAMLVRMGLLVLLAGWLSDVFDRGSVSSRRGAGASGAVLGIGVLLTMSLSGHAATADRVALSVAADLTHLIAMVLWLGGLALLTVCLLSRQRSAELAAALPGFSRLAMGCVTALVITGGYQAWRDVRYLPAFADTSFGLLLVAKMVVFLLLVALGDLARRWVARHYRPSSRAGAFGPALTAHAAGPEPAPVATSQGEPTTGAVRALRRGLSAETLIGTVVLALTAVLVGTRPAAEAYTPTYSTQVAAPGQRLQVSADPAHVGPTTLRVRLHQSRGQPAAVANVTASLTLPAQHIGPLPVTFHTGPHGATAKTQFPAAGDWLLNISVQTSPTQATTYQIRIPVIE